MNLIQRIDEDLKMALKARELEKVSTLRMLKAACGNLAIQKSKPAEKLEDGEVIEVIQRLVKQHQESVEAYAKAGRADLAQKETQEAAVLKAYLPEALSEEELKALIQATIQELGATGPASVGEVMKALMPKVKGRADGKLVNQLVQQSLGK